MVKTKRALALLLTVAMTLSCIVLPASAETEPTAPCTISLSNAEATVTAEKGSDVTVNVDISGLGDGEGWNALTLYAYYDSAILTYKKQVPGDAFKKARDAVQDEGGAVSSQVSAGRDIQDADHDGDKDEYCISIASVATNAESDPARMTGNGTLWTLTFTVKEDLESQTLPLKLVCLKATVNEDTTAMPATVDGTIAVKGVTPTLTSVTLPEGSDPVTVTGSGEPQPIQATATSAMGTPLTTSVGWSVSPVNGGVSIDAAGVITVDNKAKAGDYIITAAPKDDKVQGEAKSATLTVVRDRKPGYILPLESKTVEIPVAGTNTVDLITGVYDQFGEKLDGKIPTFDCSELNEIPGISTKLQDNVLSVSVGPDAKNAIPSSKTYTIKMSYEGLEDRNVQLTIRRAAAEVKSVVIDGAATIAVPTKAEAPKEIPYTATVQDQYCTVLTGKTVTWSIEGTAPNGVTIDKNSGKVTILPAAAKNTFDENNQLTFTVKAICEGKSATKVVTLKRVTSVAQSLAISGGQDAVAVPTGADEKVTFSAVITDQYGEEIPLGDDGVTWSVSSKVGVSIDKGVLKIENGAATFNNGFDETWKTTVTIQAECGIHKQTKTVTLTRKAPVATNMIISAYTSGGPQDTFTLPKPGDNELNINLMVQSVVDQYGCNMTTGLTKDVLWTAPAGVTISKSGEGYTNYIATIDTDEILKRFNGVRGTGETKFTLTATYDKANVSQEITLTLAGAQATSIELDGTNSDTVVIPSSNKKYTATVKDQYGLMMPGAQVTYSIEPANKGVTIDANTGLVTVSENAEKDTVYTVTAKCGGNLTDTRTFKAVDKTPHPGALTVAQNGFTYGETGKLNPTAKLGDKTVEAKFTYTIKDGAAVTTPTDAGTYTVTATYETETDIYTGTVDFTIAPATLTDSMFTLTGEYTYNGSAQTVAVETTLTSADYNVTGDQQATAGTHTVTFEGKGNYTGTVKKTWSIAKKQITAEIKNTITKSYDGTDAATVSPSDVTLNGVITGDNVIVEVESAKFASVNATSGLLIGVNVTVKLAGTDAGNYTLAETMITGNGRIDKAAHNDTTASTSAKYGNTATLDLSALGLPEGYVFAQGTVQDENGILAGAEAAGYYVISGNTLRVPLKNDSAQVNKTATITLPVSSTNYENFDLVITVTVNDKLENSLAARDISLTYGDTGYVTVTSIIGSLRTEIVAGNDVISLENGTIKTLKAGEATLKLTASGDENYAEKSIQVKVTVSPKPITLTIDSKSAYVNDAQPALTYKVNGLVGADQLTTEPVLYVEAAEGVDPMKQVGTYAIKTSVTPSAGDNYSLTVAEGTLSVTNRPSAITPVGPSAGTVRVDETEGGTVRVTPANAAEGSTVTIVVTPDQGQELRSLEVLDKDGDTLELTDLGGGRYSFEMPSGKVTVKAEFGKAGLPYNDVKEGDWFYSAVEYVTEAGLMGDTGHGSFEPNTNTTRAMIWAILARLSGVDTTPVSGPWYSVAQQWAMNSGVSDGTNPNGAITREQLVTMLYRYAETHGIDVTEGGMAIREFADVERVSSFAGPAMTWAVNTGLISGIDGKLVPQGLATRSQVATVLMRFAQLAK